jgi:hypothetical protein
MSLEGSHNRRLSTDARLQTMTGNDCVFCDLTQFRTADVCFENAFCLHASTRDPRDPPGVLRDAASGRSSSSTINVHSPESRRNPSCTPSARQWDYFHCPADTRHVIVGAGDGPCVIVAVGTRTAGEDWGAYTVDETALRHGAGVEEETTKSAEAYARFPAGEFTRYQEGWLPG